MSSLINKESELKRLNDLADKTRGIIAGIEAKLSNEAFVSKAPAKIIDGAKAQLDLNKTQLQGILSQIEEISKL